MKGHQVESVIEVGKVEVVVEKGVIDEAVTMIDTMTGIVDMIGSAIEIQIVLGPTIRGASGGHDLVQRTVLEIMRDIGTS